VKSIDRGFEPQSIKTKNYGIGICCLTSISYIMATSFSGGGSRNTRREPPTMGKQMVNLTTCSCESSAPLFVIYKAGLQTPTGVSNSKCWRLNSIHLLLWSIMKYLVNINAKRKTTTGQTMKHWATRTFIFFRKTRINLDVPEGFLLHMVYPSCYNRAISLTWSN
jgi:hypothetical protein